MLIKRTEKGTVCTKDGMFPYVSTYDQPRLDYLRFWLFHNVVEKTLWALPGVRRVEKWLWGRHEVRCNCRAQFCIYIPMTNRWDLICFELSHKNRRELSRSY